MLSLEVLNALGSAWAGFMTRAMVDGCLLLAVVLAVWLPLRRQISAQFAHGLFCLVLLKLIIPVPLPVPSWQAADAPEATPAPTVPESAPAPAIARAPTAAVLVPSTTGDLGTNLADASAAPQPVVIAESAVVHTVAIDAMRDRPPQPVLITEPVVRGAAAPARTSVPTSAAPRRTPSIAAILLLAWVLGAAVLLLRFLWALIATNRLLQGAEPVRSGWVPIDLDALERAVGLRVPVRWAVDPRLHSPAVGGLLRPSVVIPPDLCDGLAPRQLRWVLLHELAHIRRGDLWVVIGQRIAQSVFFFHPAIYLANWIIDELREYACDDTALSVCKTSRRDCGEGFLAVVERAVERAAVPAPALGLFESRMLIRRRLIRILDSRREVHARLSPRAALVLASLALGLLATPLGWSRDISARLNPGRPIASPVPLPSGARWNTKPEPGGFGIDLGAIVRDAEEPASYRPGVIWHRDAARGRAGSKGKRHSGARAVALALAYSPDGRTLAIAGDDGMVVLRDVASDRVVGQLGGHGDAVSSLAYSPDGRTLATGSFDRTVKLWDVARARERATLIGHTNWVFALAFSPDGEHLASAGHDKTVRIWDVASGRELTTLRGHAASVRAVAFAPAGGGRLLASGGADRVVLLWDLDAPNRVIRLPGHKGTVRSLAYSSDGAILASGGEDGEVRLWDPASGGVRRSLSGHTDMVTCIEFSSRGGILATGSLDTTVKIWEAGSWRERASLQGHLDGVSALAFGAGARQMATGSFDGSVRLWEPAAPVFSPSACLDYHGEARGLAFSPDGRCLRAAGAAGIARWDTRTGSLLRPAEAIHGETSAIAAAPDGTSYAVTTPEGEIRVLDSQSERPIASFSTHVGVGTLTYSPDSGVIAAGGRDATVSLWEIRGRRLLGTLQAPKGPIAAVRFSPDGRRLAVASGNKDRAQSAPGQVTFWDVATRREVGGLRGLVYAASTITFAPDGRMIAVSGPDGVVSFWDVATGRTRGSLTYAGCRTAVLSADGRYLACSRDGGDVVLWDARARRQLGLLKGHRDPVTQIVFAPDGRSLATAGSDFTVKLWSLGTRRQTARATLKGDLTPIWSVAYSPDGKVLAVGDGDGTPGTVTLWDVAIRKVKATLDGHDRGVATVTFSPDGSLVASGGWDGTIRIWDAQTGETRHVMDGLSGVCELAFSPDGRLLASAGEGKVVTLWNVETGTEESRLTGFAWPVQCVSFSPDGRFVATGGGAVDNRAGADGEVKVWDVAEQTVVRMLVGPKRAVLALSFSPDGTRLAAGGLDETIHIWELDSGEHRLTMGGLGNCVQALSYSPDGGLLAWSGRGDGLVSLHDATTGQEVVRLVGHAAVVRGIAFAPDGGDLATGGADRTIKLWDVPGSAPARSRSGQRGGIALGGR
jgi:WD40 repeat protein/beta-lactamase regulating signal transducer with metallopeptidase domain